MIRQRPDQRTLQPECYMMRMLDEDMAEDVDVDWWGMVKTESYE